MAIFRVYKESGNFVTVNKDFIHDPNLSWKAKGILLYLLSRPDDWQIYETELKKHACDGRDSLRTGIKELEKVGYIQRKRIRDDKGHFREYEYRVFEQPNHIVNSHLGKSQLGNSHLGKTDTTNNNLTNNDLTNNNTTNNVTDDTSQIFQLVSKELEMIQSPLKAQQLEEVVNEFKDNKLEIVTVAINYCKEKNKGINYLIKVLENWNKEDVNTKEKALTKLSPKKKKSNETEDVFAAMKEKLGVNE